MWIRADGTQVVERMATSLGNVLMMERFPDTPLPMPPLVLLHPSFSTDRPILASLRHSDTWLNPFICAQSGYGLHRCKTAQVVTATMAEAIDIGGGKIIVSGQLVESLQIKWFFLV